MPQNLQKRLLLYILQQLSLFSEIDLPNLEEVSLNNIHLRDVSIDPEKVGKLPGCNLRYGKLRNVDLSGGVVGGVNLNVLGVELVIAPNIDNLQTSDMLFLLAQSTAELANTVMFDDDLDKKAPGDATSGGSAIDSDSDSDADALLRLRSKTSRSASVSSNSSRKSSALGGVMGRAVEIALLRLQVTVRDIKIKFISEPADITVLVEEVYFSSTNGVRTLTIKGIKASTTKPHVNAGHRPKGAASAPGSSAVSEDEEEEEEDSGYGDELMDSMVFTHEEASSIYMSATSNTLGGQANAAAPSLPEKEAVMLHIDNIAVTFEGLAPALDVVIDVGTVRVAAVPLMPTASLIFNSIAKMVKLENHQLRKQKLATRRNDRFPEYDISDDEPDEEMEETPASAFFSGLHVAEFELSLTSAITLQGTFASTDDDISVVLSNLNIKQKSEHLVYGGVEVFKILQYSNNDVREVFHFEQEPANNQAKAELRFECFQKVEEGGLLELTALLSKPAICNLDLSSLQYLVNFATSVSTVLESLTGMLADLSSMGKLKDTLAGKSTVAKAELPESQFILQTSSLNLTLNLLTITALKAVIFPISFNKQQAQLSIQRIILSSIVADDIAQFMTIPSISLKLSPQDFQVYQQKTPHSIPRQSPLVSSATLTCGKIKGSTNFATLVTISKSVASFLSRFLGLDRKINSLSSAFKDNRYPISKPQSSATLAASIYSNQGRLRRLKTTPSKSMMFSDQSPLHASIRIALALIDFSICDVFKRFGDLSILAKRIEFYKHGNNLHGFTLSVSIHRIFKDIKEVLLEPLEQHTDSSLPMILFTQKSNEKSSSIDLVARWFKVEYYTHWLQLFEKNISQGHNAEEFAHVAPSGTSKASKKSDLRVTFSEFVLGLAPGRLPSKICVGISAGSMDFTSSREQFYIKSSFRDVSLFLIDDTRNAKVSPSSHNPLSVYNILSTTGYVNIGQINTAHLGITVNTDIAEVKRRNEQSGIRGNLSLVDLKINSDEHQIDLCADSAHTLLQTINDLKSPVVFKTEDKVKTKVEEGFHLPDDILNQLASLAAKDHAANLNLQPESKNQLVADTAHSEPLKKSRAPSEEFFIVDEYYDEPQLPESKLSASISKLTIDDSSSEIDPSLLLVEDHFSEKLKSTVVNIFPFSLNVNLSKTKIYLYDGYDWKQTRKSLRKAVKSLELRAAQHFEKKQNLTEDSVQVKANNSEKKVSFSTQDIDETPRKLSSNDYDASVLVEDHKDEDENLNDFSELLFESIHISMPTNGNAAELVDTINSQVQFDLKGEADHNSTTEASGAHTNVNVEKHYKDLKLNRSRIHKILVDLKNVEVNVTNYTSRDPRFDPTPQDLNVEKVNKVEVLLDTIDIYDNVPSSTWNKLLTYMSILGEREIGTSMLKLTMLNVRPDPRLSYSEVIIDIKVLPVRLHVDQDTLGFLTRFFDFRDSRFHLPVDEAVFIQKLVIDPLRIRFDYKPKSVDYAGIRAGNNAEFVNFFILDGSDISLQKAVVYGLLGFPKLGSALLKVYAPYIQKHQLTGLLSGLAPVRSIVNIGGGVKDLVAIPVKEYKKDGRLIRSIQKGTKSFAKTTSYELLKLGVKLASGTQVILENLEEYFGGEGTSGRRPKKAESKKDTKKIKSHSKNNLLETSHMLKRTADIEKDPYSSRKLYSIAGIDEMQDDSDLDIDQLQSSILVFDAASKSDSPGENSINEEEKFTEEEDMEKVLSLYSNPPVNAKEGLVSAYKSLGRNLNSTKKQFGHLKKDLKAADNFQQLAASIVKSSPVLVIRPLIGTTEAVMKTLMGLSNEIDSRYVAESQDKYRNDKGAHSI